ncbi:MAG: hypothetical protein NTW33_02065 [Methanoregula sp.]|nr:hypothetical protein [Methanoregula sp.]
MAADKSHSDLVLEKIRDVLSDDNYGFATAVVTYCETMSLTLNYIGMSEFRDALTHIQRVVNAENETIVAEELNSAYEHIRRAAVESYQDYVEKQFFDLERRIKSPLLYLYKVSYTHDWKNIKKSED